MKARTTEQDSNYRHLESMSIEDVLHHINHEDKLVPEAVSLVLPQLSSLIKAIVEKMRLGGRLFYLGAGTSGRLRAAVSAINARVPTIFRNCFGWASRLSGQNRSPFPPAMMQTYMVLFFMVFPV